MTLIDGSLSSRLIRGGAKLKLDNQPDTIANVSVGFENERFSLRWSANFLGELINDYDASNPILDTINKEFFAMDVNLRLNVTDWLQVYAYAVNIN